MGATLKSLYSSALGASVPGDALAPKPVVLGIINASQNSGVAQGRTLVTLNWTAPTQNEVITGETLIASASGSTETFESAYDPLVPGAYTLFDDGATITGASYSIDTNTGFGTLNNAAVVAGSVVSINYTTVLEDLSKFEVYRIAGSNPIDPGTYSNVVAGGIAVDTNVSSGATSLVDTLTANENGETWTYYVYAMDDESPANASTEDKVPLDTIPGIPQNLARINSGIHDEVQLEWDAVADDNVDGYNIYRCSGLTFTDASAVLANSVLLTGLTFEDGSENSTNRVIEASLAYPTDGSDYSYKIESQDTDSLWTSGTNNQSSGVSAVLTASLAA